MIFLNVCMWFNYTEYLDRDLKENFYLNPTNIVLLMAIIGSLFFQYKGVIIYSIIAIINQSFFYFVFNYSFASIIQKILTLSLITFFIVISSYFHYERLNMLQERSIEFNNQKQLYASNNDIINDFLRTATDNLTVPIQNFNEKLILLKNSRKHQQFSECEQNITSIKQNFNHIKSLMDLIIEVNQFFEGKFSIQNEATTIDEIVKIFTNTIQNGVYISHKNLVVTVQNDFNETILVDKGKILKILESLTKIKLNQGKRFLDLSFQPMYFDNKNFLEINVKESINENFSLTGLNKSPECTPSDSFNSNPESPQESNEILLILSNLLVNYLNGKFAIISNNNSYLIEIPIIFKV